jgi:DNA-binding XRE family transcriptional regulator
MLQTAMVPTQGPTGEQIFTDAQLLALIEHGENWALSEIHARIDRGDEELIPADIVNSILDGKNPVKVWREYRGLTQQQLADAVEISKPYLSQIETGKRTGTTEVFAAIAKALDISLEQITRAGSK